MIPLATQHGRVQSGFVRHAFSGHRVLNCTTFVFRVLMGLGIMGGMALAQAQTRSDVATAEKADFEHVGCVPVAERPHSELGCFVIASQVLGKLATTPLYWHLYSYPTQVAANAARGHSGTVVETYGKTWLFTLAEAGWNANGGQRIARIGPLPINSADSYTAVYMAATFAPGMKSRVHRHPGPEAWYVLAGEQCLETPGHKQVVRAGESGIVEQGPPMMLSGIGTAERRALVLILHDSSQPMTTPAPDWTPAGLCADGDTHH
jgi:quercetin dioxygenase-like cupin family protein